MFDTNVRNIILMRRFRHCKFYKEQRQHGKDRGLYEADENFKRHERNRRYVGCKKDRHRNKYFAGKNVSEKAEGERNKANELRDKLNDTDKERNESRTDAVLERAEWEESAEILEKPNHKDSRYLNDKKRNDRKSECDIEVRIH